MSSDGERGVSRERVGDNGGVKKNKESGGGEGNNGVGELSESRR